jgi:hypothetical protein
MSTRRTIICMKWGVKYGPDYANTLWRMLDRQLDQPFRLICFTDDHQGLRPEIEHRPLPAIGPPGAFLKFGWNKLGVFHPKIDLPAEPVLFLDLDVVLTGKMDVFFDVPGHFLISNDWNPRKPGVGNSSVFRFVPGTQDHLWKRFQSEPDRIRAKHRNDQEFISAAANGLGFWPDDLCRSYKRHCIPRWPMILWKRPTLPNNARVLIFHGDPKPVDAINGVTAKWYRPIRPAPWLREYVA